MARKFLFTIAALVILALIGLTVLRLWAADLTLLALEPRGGFTRPAPLPPGRYADPAMWLARPDQPNQPQGPARFRPEGLADDPAAPPLQARVFFVHGSTSFDNRRWNIAGPDAESDARTRDWLRTMASPFNRAAIWAPRYRQAVFGAMLTDKPEARAARDAAYADVAKGFEAFLAAIPADAPIALAGQDQGSVIVLRLLRQFVAGQPLARRVVVAYVPGWPLNPARDLAPAGLAPCDGPDRTGCAMGWTAFADPPEPAVLIDRLARIPVFATPATAATGPFLCTNPLTGGAAGPAPASANLGTLQGNLDGGATALKPAQVDAQCDAHGALVFHGAPDQENRVLPGNAWLFSSYTLFWANLRADLARREAAWVRARR